MLAVLVSKFETHFISVATIVNHPLTFNNHSRYKTYKAGDLMQDGIR